MQCRELTRNELDLVLLGQISALLSSDQDTNAKKPLPCKRSNMAFYHGGVRICRITFQKLHGIGTIPVNTYTHACIPHTCTHTHTLTHTHTHTHTKANQHHQYKPSSPNVNSHPMVILASSPGPFSAFVWQYYTCITPYRAAVLYIQVYIQFLETIELL